MTGPDRSGPSADRSDRWGFSRLTKRAQFQRVAKGLRGNVRCLSLQAAARTVADESVNVPRIGLTITRKVGGSVERNRIRRRLRAALKLTPGLEQRSTHDYVVVARREALHSDFQTLCAELARAFKRIHESRERDGRPPRGKSRASSAQGGEAQR